MSVNIVTDLFAKQMRIYDIPNDSYFSLEYDENTQSVISREYIAAGTCLGQIYGEPTYIWDITHSDYMFVDEDMVLDVSKNVPRTMLTLLRDDNQTNSLDNCAIHVEQDDKKFQTCFFVYTTRDIYPGQEVVNSVPTYR